MRTLPELFDENRRWAKQTSENEPALFASQAMVHEPRFMWIGCSDSRVPANVIVNLPPGELFVQRNIGNIVREDDFNCMSAIQYAIESLKIKDIIVCGHYDCGGIKAVLHSHKNGLMGLWLEPIQKLYEQYHDDLLNISDEVERANRLCELNVIQQVTNMVKVKSVQNAWKRGQEVTIHGWMYSLETGLLHDMDVSVSSLNDEHKLQAVEIL